MYLSFFSCSPIFFFFFFFKFCCCCFVLFCFLFFCSLLLFFRGQGVVCFVFSCLLFAILPCVLVPEQRIIASALPVSPRQVPFDQGRKLRIKNRSARRRFYLKWLAGIVLTTAKCGLLLYCYFSAVYSRFSGVKVKTEVSNLVRFFVYSFYITSSNVCVRACVRASVRACVRACVRVCVCVCVFRV